jgi:hypothetical protein
MLTERRIKTILIKTRRFATTEITSTTYFDFKELLIKYSYLLYEYELITGSCALCDICSAVRLLGWSSQTKRNFHITMATPGSSV